MLLPTPTEDFSDARIGERLAELVAEEEDGSLTALEVAGKMAVSITLAQEFLKVHLSVCCAQLLALPCLALPCRWVRPSCASLDPFGACHHNTDGGGRRAPVPRREHPRAPLLSQPLRGIRARAGGIASSKRGGHRVAMQCTAMQCRGRVRRNKDNITKEMALLP
jgi:hypothetical protein